MEIEWHVPQQCTHVNSIFDEIDLEDQDSFAHEHSNATYLDLLIYFNESFKSKLPIYLLE